MKGCLILTPVSISLRFFCFFLYSLRFRLSLAFFLAFSSSDELEDDDSEEEDSLDDEELEEGLDDELGGVGGRDGGEFASSLSEDSYLSFVAFLRYPPSGICEGSRRNDDAGFLFEVGGFFSSFSSPSPTTPSIH